MYFDVALSAPDVTNSSIFCARFESNTTGWIGFGISPTKGMVGAEAVIGVPADGTVKKYVLFDKDVSAVTAMDDADQTLMDTSITQDGEGRTIMKFTKYLYEDKYGIIPNDFINSFIWAMGSSNELDYHGSSRGNFGMDLLTTLPPSSAPPSVLVETAAPSVASVDGSSAPSLTVAAGTGATEGITTTPAPSLTTESGATEGVIGSPGPSLTVATSSSATEGNDNATPAPTATAGMESPAPTLIDIGDNATKTSSSPTLVGTGAETSEVPITESTAASVETTVQTAESEDVVTTIAPFEGNTTTEEVEGSGDDRFEYSSSVEGAEEDASSASFMEIGGFYLLCGYILGPLLI
jgi:hypothetical protein